MKKFVFILAMLLFVVVSNASPPPDPAFCFSADTGLVIQDNTNVDLFFAQAQEVAYVDIGNASQVPGNYLSHSLTGTVFIFREQFSSTVNNVNTVNNNCYLSDIKSSAYLRSINGIYGHKALFKPLCNNSYLKDLKHSNYGYPFTAERS